MTFRQKILKFFYPAWVWLAKISDTNNKILKNSKQVSPPQPVYNLSVPLNDGKQLPLKSLKGKKVLIVNTASDCGYTGQYDELQKLSQQFSNSLTIIGFPANDFKEQEKGSDEEIAQFCRINYGITFPLAKKSTVIGSSEQTEVFKWLTDKSLNGWNEKQPSWNFSKYLLDENGVLVAYFDPSISPLNEEVLKFIR
jgi:glutathione peroxidase